MPLKPLMQKALRWEKEEAGENKEKQEATSGSKPQKFAASSVDCGAEANGAQLL